MAGALSADLTAEIKRRRSQLQTSAYLGIIAEPDDVVWLTTMDELREILLLDAVLPLVKRFSGLHSSLIQSKMDELREIRNAVGHNRPLSRKTCSILEAAVLSLEDGFARLESSVMAGPESRGVSPELSDGELGALFDVVLSERGPVEVDTDRLVLSDDRFFYYASLLPRHALRAEQTGVVELGQWVDARRLMQVTRGIRSTLTAILLPFRGTSFEFVWSRKAGRDQDQAVLRAFVGVADGIWGDLDYDSQDERVLTDASVWFIT